jgi:hypothetical protein
MSDKWKSKTYSAESSALTVEILKEAAERLCGINTLVRSTPEEREKMAIEKRLKETALGRELL